MSYGNPFKTPFPPRKPGRKNEKPGMGPLSPVKGMQLPRIERLTIDKTRRNAKPRKRLI